MSEVREMIESQLGRIKGDIDGFMEARKEKEIEIGARLRELEQKAARRGGDAGPLSYSDEESPGAMVIKAEGLVALRSGEIKSVRIPVKSVKAAVTNITYPGVPYRDPEVYGPLPRRVTVTDLIPSKPTSASTIDYVQAARVGTAGVQLVTDSPVTTEGAIKPEIGITTTLVAAKVITVAGWSSMSRQALDDNDGLQDFINSTLLDALELATEDEILNGDGSTGHMLGLMTVATAYSRAVGGDQAADTLRRAITQVQIARGVPDGIVLHPADAEALELLKDDQHRYLLELEVTDGNGRTVLWRVPTVISDAIDEGDFLVGDFTRGVRIYDRMAAMIALSVDHADFFVRNLVAALVERRLALTVPRPLLLIKGTFS